MKNASPHRRNTIQSYLVLRTNNRKQIYRVDENVVGHHPYSPARKQWSKNLFENRIKGDVSENRYHPIKIMEQAAINPLNVINNTVMLDAGSLRLASRS